MAEPIRDWDDAYANSDHVPGADALFEAWPGRAAALRADADCQLDIAYGDGERERFDLFQPEGSAKGLFVFVHGGYWMALDKSFWSHLAAGPLSADWAVAMPSYTLCPDIRISGITQQIGAAVSRAAGMVDGPIVLAGHSAGGHLVSRMGCRDAPLADGVAARVTRIVSISGVHDLRPLLRTKINETLRIDAEEADRESPALLSPREGLSVDCVVGGDERPEFVRQNALLANVWTGLGAATREFVVPGRHHFDIIDGLCDPATEWLTLG